MDDLRLDQSCDSRGPNSLDMWVTENGRSFVRHYLLDYNAILGAGANGSRAYQTGFEYYVDFGVMGRHLASLGLEPFPWEHSVDPHMPSVGFVESKVFDPAGWRPDYPNPSFDDRTERDIRWGAKIVGGFTDDHIRSVVAAAHYTDPRAAEYITRFSSSAATSWCTAGSARTIRDDEPSVNLRQDNQALPFVSATP